MLRQTAGTTNDVVRCLAADRVTGKVEGVLRALIAQVDRNNNGNAQRNPQDRQRRLPGAVQ